jgi:hypothetical protein
MYREREKKVTRDGGRMGRRRLPNAKEQIWRMSKSADLMCSMRIISNKIVL